MASPRAQRRASYGIDSPGTLIGLGAGSLAALGVLVITYDGTASWWISVPFLLTPVVATASFLYTTLRGKRVVWLREVDRLALRGDERALDLGCGRGLVLVAFAQRLPEGEVTGVDRWRSVDQSGNDAGATQRNAAAEGVGGRVGLVTADMRKLPFDAGSFDVVVSSLAIHNIDTTTGRRAAVTEAFRVTRPGGEIRIADFRHCQDYAAVLAEAGAIDVVTRALGWRFWYGGPFFATTMVCARKRSSL